MPCGGTINTMVIREDVRGGEAAGGTTTPTKPVLVVLGGLAQTADSFTGHHRALAKGRPCVIQYEARGQGCTQLATDDCSLERHAGDFADLLAALGQHGGDGDDGDDGDEERAKGGEGGEGADGSGEGGGSVKGEVTGRGKGGGTGEGDAECEGEGEGEGAILAADVRASIAAKGVDLCGFSFGGRVCTAIAATHPELVRKLVVTGVPARRDTKAIDVLNSWRRALAQDRMKDMLCV